MLRKWQTLIGNMPNRECYTVVQEEQMPLDFSTLSVMLLSSLVSVVVWAAFTKFEMKIQPDRFS
jgi:hypothetical protein